jgi:hypothetical protein
LDKYAEGNFIGLLLKEVLEVFECMIDEQIVPDADGGKKNIESEFAHNAEILQKDGVVVVPVLDKETNVLWNKEFFEMARTWPEYVHEGKTIEQEDATRRVFGAFGAYGNPSSFHDAPVRAWRKFLHDKVSVNLFAHILKKNERLSVLIDRLQQRCQFKDRIDAHGNFCKDQLRDEEWHCDHSPNILPGDQVFGGWINLDVDHYQSFHCVKGSQRTQTGKQGFVKFSDEEKIKFGESKSEIKIPPGHMIIFDQTIVHCVNKGASPEKPSIRMYMGHWITKSKRPLFPSMLSRIADLAVPQIPSGQWPVMFSQNHFSMASHIFHNTLGVFVQKVCQERHTKDGKAYYTPDLLTDDEIVNEDESKGIPAKNLRCMRSLRMIVDDDTLLQRFVYTDEDLNILKPHKIN